MKIFKCDKCKKEIKDGKISSVHYFDWKDNQNYNGQQLVEHLCESCFESLKRFLQEIPPQCLNDKA